MDARFREAFARDPREAAAKRGLDVDPEEIRALWDPAACRRLRADEAAGRDGSYPLPVRRFRSYQREKRAFRDAVRQAARPRDPRMAAWRERQINRSRLELGLEKAATILHVPAAFELSEGCSVGCWFCAVGAVPAAGVWTYEAHRELWRGTLETVREVVGAGAQWGFCYWATEPLDNPDYERFCEDFRSVLGRFPQTTTALPMRDPQRTRRLLALASAPPPTVLSRFSILSCSVLDQVHAEFSPEELIAVDLVPVTPGSLLPKVNAGHARQKGRTRRSLREPEERSTTIACITGFLFRMPSQTVQLITPCPASDRWPLGYRILETGRFGSSEELRALLAGMIGRHMLPALKPDQEIRFGEDIPRSRDPRHPRASAPLWASLDGHPRPDDLAALIAAGDRTAGEIALDLERRHGVPMPQTFFALDRLLASGVLQESIFEQFDTLA